MTDHCNSGREGTCSWPHPVASPRHSTHVHSDPSGGHGISCTSVWNLKCSLLDEYKRQREERAPATGPLRQGTIRSREKRRRPGGGVSGDRWLGPRSPAHVRSFGGAEGESLTFSWRILSSASLSEKCSTLVSCRSISVSHTRMLSLAPSNSSLWLVKCCKVGETAFVLLAQ